jgi:restriction system protein
MKPGVPSLCCRVQFGEFNSQVVPALEHGNSLNNTAMQEGTPENKSFISVSDQRPVYGARGNVLSYEVVVKHHGLNKHRIIKARDSVMLRNKILVQTEEWNISWQLERARIARTEARESQMRRTAADKTAHKLYIEQQKENATLRTAEARVAHAQIDTILEVGLHHSTTIDWTAQKDISPFSVESPARVPNPNQPSPTKISALPTETIIALEPQTTDKDFTLQFGILDRIFSGFRAKKERVARLKFDAAHQHWVEEKAEAWRNYEEALADWQRESKAAELADAERRVQYHELVSRQEIEFQRRVREWELARDDYDAHAASARAAIDTLCARYEAVESDAVEEICDMMLASSKYPDFCPHEFEIEYSADSRVVVIEYALPSPDALPTLTEVKYVQATDSFAEKFLSEAKRGEMYDRLLYQITLRTLFELFSGDVVSALASAVFNGFVTAIDKSTGKEVTACVLSVHAAKDSFLEIDLGKVDPKLCFRQLRGVGSSKLHSVAAIAPIMSVRREDSRFVIAREIAERLDEGYNLASMDWEDFEHLIREIFGREFSSNGGEVRVTQASRDGGVDAVAFDPDPIRGGKIVIQAKRYTHTVGVAAVRDLYGTVMNEGATKGILVTTADYGPDAYEFAKGKPLTLLNGANLLSLLEKHGVRARIDLIEARRQAAENAPG